MNSKGVLKWALSIGIIIVLNVFFAVALDIVKPEPQYQDFCPQSAVQPSYPDEASCVAAGGQWTPNPEAGADAIAPASDGTTLQREEMAKKYGTQIAGYCNANFTCSQKYADSQKSYERFIFISLVVLGALSLLAGILIRISPAVSAGLSYGGVLSFIIASVRYWSAAGDLIRLGIVTVALAALIWIGIRKFKE